MKMLLRTLSVLTLLLSLSTYAQTADQEVVSVVDSPDPVTAGSTLSYTVTIRNNGPDPATNGGLNINLPGSVTHATDAVPAGWTCFWAGNNGTCNTPSFAAGTTEILTINATVGAHLANFPDQDIVANFFPSGTTPDPNNANNAKLATTTVDAPQIDLLVTATDSPDPVFPDGNVTYSVTLTNGGPDTATNVNFNVVPNSSLRFQSVSAPAGWSCITPAVGAINATFTCSRASWAPDTDNFTVVFSANDEQFGINDTTFQTYFGVNGSGDDTNDANNNVIVQTAYVTPDADVTVSVTDSPDPVAPDGNITYTVTVGNTGPDTAPSITLNSFGANNLRFVSATTPAGWNCTLPAPNAQTVGFSCNLPAGLPNGGTSVLTFVLQATDELLGINDQTILFGFSANSSVSDPDGTDNSETESTQYTTPDADVSVSVTDSPDPVAPDGNITYTVTVGNTGPDTAPDVTLSSFGANNLRFLSASTPAGWDCTLPPPNTQTTGLSCNLPAGLPNGGTSVLTFVMQATDELLGINDLTILFGFSAHSSVSDPDGTDNSETESTQYATPDADLSITATDSPDPVANGNELTFTINAANGGPDAAPSAHMVAAPHPSLVFVSLTAPAGWTCTTPAVDSSGVTDCSIASFAASADASFTLVTRLVTAGAGGTLESNFFVSSSLQDPDPLDNNITVTTNWVGQTTDLSISKNTLSTAAAQGSNITYTIATTNSGPDDASNVTITDVLPAALRFVSITSPAGWTCTTPAVGATGTITCSIATLTNGATANFTLVTSVDPGATGTITNSATVGGGGTDPTPGNGSGSAGAVEVAGNADLGITKSTATAIAAPGEVVSYTIQVTNAGPEAAASVVVTDALPASLLFQSITAPAGWSCTTPAVGATGTVTCEADTLVNGATATFTLTTTVAPAATGTITNSASVTHSGTDGNGGNSSGSSGGVEVDAPTSSADLAVTKTTAATTAPAGSTFQYTITASNAGPDAAGDVVVTDILPASLLFESITTPAGFTCTTPAVGSSGTITCNAVTLAADAMREFTLTVRVADDATSGSVVNGVTISSATPEGNSGDDADDAPPVPLAPADAALSIEKTTSETELVPGQNVTYIITVDNAGPSPATNVVVTDVIPTGLSLISVTPSQGTCSGTTTVTCSMGTLNAGASATVTLIAEVTATSGTIANTASVASPDSNGDSDTTTPIPVGGPAPAAATAIPTLSEWALLAMALLLGAFAVTKMRMS